MDKWSDAQWSVGWNFLSIPKHQSDLGSTTMAQVKEICDDFQKYECNTGHVRTKITTSMYPKTFRISEFYAYSILTN